MDEQERFQLLQELDETGTAPMMLRVWAAEHSTRALENATDRFRDLLQHVEGVSGKLFWEKELTSFDLALRQVVGQDDGFALFQEYMPLLEALRNVAELTIMALAAYVDECIAIQGIFEAAETETETETEAAEEEEEGGRSVEVG